MSDEIIILFGGRKYPGEQIWRHKGEIDLALLTDRHCPDCHFIDSCVMPSKGWQIFYDERDSAYYRQPSFRVRRCKVAQEEDHIAEAEEQEAQITARYQAKTFDTFKETEFNRQALEKCREYAERLDLQTQHGLFLMGGTGTGKTHLATAITKEAGKKSISFGFVGTVALLDEIRKGYENKEVYDLAARTMEKQLLVIDDLGAERAKDWASERLYKLINYRYENMMPTIVTTNCTIEELEDRYGYSGRRMVDRIMEMCTAVKIGGPSWRRRR